MGYLQDVEKEIHHLFEPVKAIGNDSSGIVYAVPKDLIDAVVKLVKAKVLESYKNGIEAARLVQKGKELQGRAVKKEINRKRA